eukprot:1302072-Prymnesium_polylepis.1
MLEHAARKHLERRPSCLARECGEGSVLVDVGSLGAHREDVCVIRIVESDLANGLKGGAHLGEKLVVGVVKGGLGARGADCHTSSGCALALSVCAVSCLSVPQVEVERVVPLETEDKPIVSILLHVAKQQLPPLHARVVSHSCVLDLHLDNIASLH